MEVLEIKGLRKEFGGVIALTEVDVSIESDKIVGIIGPNGSGKTTLFNVIAGLYKPTAGRVLWQGKDITGHPTYQIARMGLVRTFQQAMSYPGLSVRENVRIACEHGRSRGVKSNHKWSSAEEILSFVGLAALADELAGSMPFGNLRRLGIAVSLGANPLLLLLDEPAAGLSDSETAELTELILRFPGFLPLSCWWSRTRYWRLAVASRGYLLQHGQIVASGPIAELRDNRLMHDSTWGKVAPYSASCSSSSSSSFSTSMKGGNADCKRRSKNENEDDRGLAKACCEMSRRDGAIVAWHEVPGTAPPQKSRPVGTV
jgi:branched-chain amino acid transport system ATP-binding protein